MTHSCSDYIGDQVHSLAGVCRSLILSGRKDLAVATQAHTVPHFYLRGFVDPASESRPNLDPFVWVGSLTTGEIKRRAPRNISIVPGLYDGPGGLNEPDASLEAHLGKIESAAAFAI